MARRSLKPVRAGAVAGPMGKVWICPPKVKVEQILMTKRGQALLREYGCILADVSVAKNRKPRKRARRK